MNRLINEFNAMVSNGRMPIFEIGEDVHYLAATERGLEAGGAANVGFMPYGIYVAWDEDRSLDWHLEGLYSILEEDTDGHQE